MFRLLFTKSLPATMKEDRNKQAEINKKWRKCEGRNGDLNSTERIQGKRERSRK